jgi:Zn finger protein HypA/HybF involved in hydrogenase expression
MSVPTKAQVEAYKRGEQKLWRCPDCSREIEVLSLMVFCSRCKDERKVLVSMARVESAVSPPQTTEGEKP